MKDLNNSAQYWEEVRSTASYIVEEAIQLAEDNEDPCIRDSAEEIINDYLLHEQIDGHQWIIYTAYHRPIVDFTINEDAYLDIYGNEDLGRIIAEEGMEQVEMIRAFWAFYQDVQEAVYEALEGMD